MTTTLKFAWRFLVETCGSTQGSQIIELAVSLPLLVLIMVGVTDFGQAFRLKHQLEIAAQDAARVAANQTMADISNANPNSTEAVRNAVEGAFVSMRINDCGLNAVTGSKAGLVWTYSSAGCAGPLTVTVDRGSTFDVAGGTPVKVEATHITISYPYQWRFNRVVQLLFSGSFTGPSQIQAEATAQNLN
jgi:Flp pilus assembly protein TadG